MQPTISPRAALYIKSVDPSPVPADIPPPDPSPSDAPRPLTATVWARPKTRRYLTAVEPEDIVQVSQVQNDEEMDFQQRPSTSPKQTKVKFEAPAPNMPPARHPSYERRVSINKIA